MNIAFIYACGRKSRYDIAKSGSAPTEFFYGAIELERYGHTVTHFEVDNTSSKYQIKLINKLSSIGILPARLNSNIISHIYEMLDILNSQDVIVATNPMVGYGLATYKAFGKIRPPIISILSGLVNSKPNYLRRRIISILLKNMVSMLYGEGELKHMKKFFYLPDERILVNQFGIDTNFWKPKIESGDYILSVGNDGRRDFETLLQAASKSDDRYVIVTRRKLNSTIPPNVKLIRGSWKNQAVTDSELRDLYQKAKFVVVPLIDSPQPSGQSVCLQAMSCGKPVILTRTSGLWSNTILKDNDNVVLVPICDSNALLDKINRISKDKTLRERIGRNARESALASGNIKDFAERLEKLCERAR